jgi:hypothetical protein
MNKAEKLKLMDIEDILEHYNSVEDCEKVIEKCQPYNLAVETIRDKTKRLELARDWLLSKNSNLFFTNFEESEN